MCSKNRTQNLVKARQVAMYLSRELTDMSLPQIGSEFGKRDHTTVIHAYQKIKTQLASDSKLKNNVMVLMTDIKNHGL